MICTLAPGMAAARPVTLTTNLTQYGGNGAYLAIYVTDASGAYAGSLWMAGGKSKYYKHLSDWAQFTVGDVSQVDGITGASVGSGRSLELSMDLIEALVADDSLFANGWGGFGLALHVLGLLLGLVYGPTLPHRRHWLRRP